MLLPGLDFYYNAFNSLCSDRQVGMGIGPIPWSSIDRFAARYDLDEHEFEVFHYYMRRMDHAFVQHQQSKKAMGQKAAKKPTGLTVREKGKPRGETGLQ